jgi:hypothetical protein
MARHDSSRSIVESTRRSFIGNGSAVVAASLLVARRLEAKVIEPITVTEQMMYSTARIVGMNAAGAQFKTGTGFFYMVSFRRWPTADSCH